MIGLGAWLFLSVVLVLAVFHRGFRKVALWTVALGAAAAFLIFSGLYGWSRYTEYRTQKALEAKGAAYKAEYDACIQRIRTVTTKWDFAVCTANHFAQAASYKDIPEDAYVTPEGVIVVPVAPVEPKVQKLKSAKSEWVDVPYVPTFHYANEKESFGRGGDAIGFGDDSKTRYIQKSAFCNADNHKAGDIFIAVAPSKTDYYINLVDHHGDDPRVSDYETSEQKIAAGDKIAAETFNKACKAAQ